MADGGHISQLKPDPRNLHLWYNSSMETTNIYGLVDPRTNDVRYVGKSNDVSPRLSYHLMDARKGKTDYKSRWIASLLRIGLVPPVVVLEVCSVNIWKERECYWIARYRSIGGLTNSKDGGDGLDVTPEIRARISQAAKGRTPHNKGKPTPSDVRLRQSHAARLRWEGETVEQRRVRIERMQSVPAGRSTERGWRHTEEARRKIADANRARSRLTPDDVREMRRLRLAGTKLTDLGTRFGVTPAMVSCICKRKAYADVE